MARRKFSPEHVTAALAALDAWDLQAAGSPTADQIAAAFGMSKASLYRFAAERRQAAELARLRNLAGIAD